MDTRSIIVAIASPPGHSPRGLVRLSGAGSRRLVGEIARTGSVGSTLGAANLPRGAHVARLCAPAPECPCLLVVMPGPGSSTAEDCVEIHVAGNPHLLESIVAALVAASAGAARRAGPGEFSARAVLNGRLSLLQAERVAWAVAAATDAQLAAADALRSERAGVATADTADRVATLLALVEAGIDFTDQDDVSAIAPARLAQEVGALAERLDALAAADAGAESAMVAPLVVLAGPPNAGKSSLFNALLGRTRAVAAPAAGTTRDVLREPLNLSGGVTVILVDAPGLEDARTHLDVLMQAQAEDALVRADVVLWCTPVGAPPCTPPPLRAQIVHTETMADLVPDVAAGARLRTSALSGTGIPELRSAIAAAVRTQQTLGTAERLRLGMLQRELLTQAVAALQDAVAIARTAPLGSRVLPNAELVAAALRTALNRLGEVAGAIPPDEVLGRLFATFCIGK